MRDILYDWFKIEMKEIAELVRLRTGSYDDIWEQVRELMLEMSRRRGFSAVALYAMPMRQGYEWYWHGWTVTIA